MISILIEAALRALLFGLVVAIGLRAFRVRNVVAQKAAWTFVLVAAFAMPLLRPMTARWHVLPTGANILLPAHPMTLLEELQAKIQAHGGFGSRPGSVAEGSPQGGRPWAEKPSVSVQGSAQNPHAKENQPGTAQARQKQTAVASVQRSVSLVANQSSSGPNRIRLTLSGFALGLYLCGQGAFLIWAPQDLQTVFGLLALRAAPIAGAFWGPSIFGLITAALLVTRNQPSSISRFLSPPSALPT